MLNKIAILIITYKNHIKTDNLVNQLNYYDKNLYDLTVIDNSINNVGFEPAIKEWLSEVSILDYAGYWLLNNDIELDLKYNYLNRFLELIKYDDEIGIITTRLTDDTGDYLPQKDDEQNLKLVSYADFQNAVLTRTFIKNYDLRSLKYFFGGFDIDACVFVNKNNLKNITDYTLSVYHKNYESKNKITILPVEDLKNHIHKYDLKIDVSSNDFHTINGMLIYSILTSNHADIDPWNVKNDYAFRDKLDYGLEEFKKGIAIYTYGTFQESKKFFMRSLIGGYLESIGYLIGASNYTELYSDVSELLQPYVNYDNYDNFRGAYEYVRAQETYFTNTLPTLKTYVFHVVPDAGHLWDPKHTDEGVGGSEIAVINLSKELAKLGNKVFVFNNCHTPGVYDGVTWYTLNTFDEFEKLNTIDILIVSRYPEFRFVQANAKIYYWAHDLNYYQRITTANWQYFDKFLVLSRYHYKFFSEAYPWIPKSAFEILPNGLDLSRFDQVVKRNNKKLIYSSNPDRGLTFLFDIFEELHKWDPELELHVFGYYPENIRKHPTYWREIPGVIYRGYHKQYELAAEYLSSKLWLYPCTWLETFCITALEAQAAGTPSVVSSWGPLKDRVGNAGIVIDGFQKDLEHQQKFIDAIKTLLTNETLWEQYSQAGKEQVKNSTWKNSAIKLMEITNKCQY